MTIGRGDGHLLVKFPFVDSPYVFVPVSPTVFEMTDTDARMTFRRDERDRATGAVFKIGDAERVSDENREMTVNKTRAAIRTIDRRSEAPPATSKPIGNRFPAGYFLAGAALAAGAGGAGVSDFLVALAAIPPVSASIGLARASERPISLAASMARTVFLW